MYVFKLKQCLETSRGPFYPKILNKQEDPPLINIVVPQSSNAEKSLLSTNSLKSRMSWK